jgi:hypothetical protein
MPPRSVNFTALPIRLSQDLAEPAFVADQHLRQGAVQHGDQVERLAARVRQQQGHHVLDDLARPEPGRARLDLAGIDAGEIEDVVDRDMQGPTGDCDDVDAAPLHPVERGVRQQADGADRRVDRRAQFMADGRQEIRLRPVRLVGLGQRRAQIVGLPRQPGREAFVLEAQREGLGIDPTDLRALDGKHQRQHRRHQGHVGLKRSPSSNNRRDRSGRHGSSEAK